MFTFGFSNGNSIENNPNKDSQPLLKLNWLPSKEIFLTSAIKLNDAKKESKNIQVINLGSEKISYYRTEYSISALITDKSVEDEIFRSAEKSHSDLIPSKYEGGLKLWECTLDLGLYLTSTLVEGKTVLDLGCGLGLLGILSLRMGAASAVFQDYNADVLRYATIPNVLLNLHKSVWSGCRFFSGDWSFFTELCPIKCDLIVTSETIYNPENYLKLHETIRRLLQPAGVALVAAKTYYFGVGGSTRQFEKLIHEQHIFNVEVVWQSTQGVKREILKLTFKNDINSEGKEA